MPPTHTDEGLRAAQEIRAAPSRDRDRDPLPGTSRPARRCSSSPSGPTGSATCSRTASPTSRTSPARCAGSPPAAGARPAGRHPAARERRPTTGRWPRSPPASARCSRSSPRAARTRAPATAWASAERAVQKHVTSIFDKLGLDRGRGGQPPDPGRPHLPAPGRAPTRACAFQEPPTPADSLRGAAPGWDLGQAPDRNPGENPPCSPPSPCRPPRRPPSSPP